MRREPMPSECGLHFFERPSGESCENSLDITINTDQKTRLIYGIRIEMLGMNLHLCMRKLIWQRPEFCMYRPSGFCFEDIHSWILFSWSSQCSSKVIVIRKQDNGCQEAQAHGQREV